jgi:glycoprotein G2
MWWLLFFLFVVDPTAGATNLPVGYHEVCDWSRSKYICNRYAELPPQYFKPPTYCDQLNCTKCKAIDQPTYVCVDRYQYCVPLNDTYYVKYSIAVVNETYPPYFCEKRGSFCRVEHEFTVNGDGTYCAHHHCVKESACYCHSLDRASFSLLALHPNIFIKNPAIITFSACLSQNAHQTIIARDMHVGQTFKEFIKAYQNVRTCATDPPVEPSKNKLIMSITPLDLHNPDFSKFADKKMVYLFQGRELIHEASSVTHLCEHVCQVTIRPNLDPPTPVAFLLYEIESKNNIMWITVIILFSLLHVFVGIIIYHYCLVMILPEDPVLHRVRLYWSTKWTLITTRPRTISPAPSIPLVNLSLLLCLCIGTPVYTINCDHHVSIESSSDYCFEIPNKPLACNVTTQVLQILNQPGTSTCIQIYNATVGILLTLHIEYLDVFCDWHTNLDYYTATFQPKVNYEVYCGGHKDCQDGDKCTLHPTHAQPYKNLFAEKPYPIFSSCQSDTASIFQCLAIPLHGTKTCVIYAWQLRPEYNNIYEVRSVYNVDCKPRIRVSMIGKDKVSKLPYLIPVHFNTDIIITSIGALHQDFLSIRKQFVVSTSRPTDIFYTFSAPPGFPKPEEIGNIQFAYPYATYFDYSFKQVECIIFHKTLRCQALASPLDNLVVLGKSRLPQMIGTHKLYYNETVRQFHSVSTKATPAFVTFKINNAKFRILTTEVCPILIRNSLSVTGCYSCIEKAQISFIAKSICSPGTVQVYMKKLQTNPVTVQLTHQDNKYVMDFQAYTALFEDYLCMASPTHVETCHGIVVNLSSPIVTIYVTNKTYIIATEKLTDSQPDILAVFLSVLGNLNPFKQLIYIGIILIVSLLWVFVIIKCAMLIVSRTFCSI